MMSAEKFPFVTVILHLQPGVSFLCPVGDLFNTSAKELGWVNTFPFCFVFTLYAPLIHRTNFNSPRIINLSNCELNKDHILLWISFCNNYLLRYIYIKYLHTFALKLYRCKMYSKQDTDMTDGLPLQIYFKLNLLDGCQNTELDFFFAYHQSITWFTCYSLPRSCVAYVCFLPWTFQYEN